LHIVFHAIAKINEADSAMLHSRRVITARYATLMTEWEKWCLSAASGSIASVGYSLRMTLASAIVSHRLLSAIAR
jgi:hypothetical protein